MKLADADGASAIEFLHKTCIKEHYPAYHLTSNKNDISNSIHRGGTNIKLSTKKLPNVCLGLPIHRTACDIHNKANWHGLT